MATTKNNPETPLDTVKDLVSIIHDRIGTAFDLMSCNGIDFDAAESVLENLVQNAYEALGQHVEGITYGGNFLPLYATPEAFRASRTYDDGSPIVETITFPDIPGMSFPYRPRHDGDRDEFVKWAREEAEEHAADVHSRYVSVGGLGIEYIESPDNPFIVHLGEDARGELDRGQLTQLREGIDRILSTQARTESKAEASNFLEDFGAPSDVLGFALAEGFRKLHEAQQADPEE